MNFFDVCVCVSIYVCIYVCMTMCMYDVRICVCKWGQKFPNPSKICKKSRTLGVITSPNIDLSHKTTSKNKIQILINHVLLKHVRKQLSHILYRSVQMINKHVNLDTCHLIISLHFLLSHDLSSILIIFFLKGKHKIRNTFFFARHKYIN